MENPVEEISSVIQNLTSTKTPYSLKVLESTLNEYFTSDASFAHPLCAIPPAPNSREYILGIYQWYKVLFVNVELEVLSIDFEQPSNKLYVGVRQACTFRYFKRTATVELLTALSLRKARKHDKDVYYISRQNDLYQTEEWVHFLIPCGRPIIEILKLMVGIFCYYLSLIGLSLGMVTKP
ncbi:hypothetical protein TWF696_005941 [Orbilia brochopaga]|uniref:SigF-like NTF2-like domain-containing protein n=1 Tax=Orbilia brochopaga TaxID=3140254 RepID=A0AAV9UUU4_9PEZI